jgi:hypothetical protein
MLSKTDWDDGFNAGKINGAEIILQELDKRIEFITDGQGHHEIIVGLDIARAIVKGLLK